jgi:tetratricopeptide (TPR) repeat protein
MADFDKLWNYNDPTATELKFNEVLDSQKAKEDTGYFLELHTQIARTHGLRAQFDQAHEILDDVSGQLPAEDAVVHVRYHLERGRTYNSSGKKDEAKLHFKKAREIAERLKEEGYAIDAIHMLAIAAPADEAIRLNEEALLIAEGSENKGSKGWLGALYNNLGWAYFDRGDYGKALDIFERSLKWREGQKSAREIIIAKWCIARTFRALERLDEALAIQSVLLEETTKNGQQEDGYISEELGELALLKNDKLKSAFHFRKAYGLLSQDVFLQKFEKQRLERMKELSAIA